MKGIIRCAKCLSECFLAVYTSKTKQIVKTQTPPPFKFYVTYTKCFGTIKYIKIFMVAFSGLRSSYTIDLKFAYIAIYVIINTMNISDYNIYIQYNHRRKWISSILTI